MTLQQWLESPENIYEELIIVDKNGEEQDIFDKNDPRYNAKVIDVKRGCNICVAEVMVEVMADWEQ